jgi:hypothetical protein
MPFYPQSATSEGACLESLLFHSFHFRLTFDFIKELGECIIFDWFSYVDNYLKNIQVIIFIIGLHIQLHNLSHGVSDDNISKKIKCKDFFFILFNNWNVLFMINKWKHQQRFLYRGSNINKNILWVFIFLYFLINERKMSSTPYTCLLMLEANKSNSKATSRSSSISESKAKLIPTCYFNFKLIVMVKFWASVNNQWPLDWFRTKVITIKDKKSIIVWEIRQVTKSGTQLETWTWRVYGLYEIIRLPRTRLFVCKPIKYSKK